MWVKDKVQLGSLLTDYFSEIFKSSPSNVESVVQHVLECISMETNEFFTEPYSAEEIKVAISSMQSEKSPGMDGFNISFYQNN